MSTNDGKAKNSFLLFFHRIGTRKGLSRLFLCLFLLKGYNNLQAETKILASFDGKELPVSFTFKASMLPSQANQVALRQTSSLVYPGISSGKSLLVWLPDAYCKYSWNLKWKSPLLLPEFPEILEFRVYSSLAGGKLYLLFTDHFGETHKKKLSTLNFDGWKKIQYSFSGAFIGNDKVYQSTRKLYFNGFLYQPPPYHVKRKKATLLVFDDISLQFRKKYLFWQEEKAPLK